MTNLKFILFDLPLNKWAVACLLCTGALMCATPAGATEPVKVFLLAGQSNMQGSGDREDLAPLGLDTPQGDVLFYQDQSGLTILQPRSSGFGPEVLFGRTIADAFPDESFALIKYAEGGRNLHTHFKPGTGTNHAEMVNTITNGLAALDDAGHTVEIVGMLWTQGERDVVDSRTTLQYQTDLNEFIADVRSRYGADLPFFLSRLSTGQTQYDPNDLAAIRAAQENIATNDPFAWMIDTDGFSIKSDLAHFDSNGQIQLGSAFGQAYMASVPEPTALAAFAIASTLVMLRSSRHERSTLAPAHLKQPAFDGAGRSSVRRDERKGHA